MTMMDIDIPRVVIAGDRSSAGKTTLCIGLLSLLRERGLQVQGVKVGLDYIDPGFHTLVSGRQSRNLDGFLMSPEVVKELFGRACEDADIAIIEGVRGLYEGLNYYDDVGSTAQIAKILQCPVILVVDAASITRSAAALVNGYRSFDPEVNLSGVILNNIGSSRHGEKAERAVEEYCGLKVIGKIPWKSNLAISMRHLGLITAMECKSRWDDFNSVLKSIKETVESNLDISAVLEIANTAPALKLPEPRLFQHKHHTHTRPRVRIGVAFDEAFNFYYHDTLDLLRQEGAEIVYFSPIRARRLPEGLDALYIGGGFPEIYARELAANTQMRRAIRAFHDAHGVMYAECGGLMYLLDELEYGGDTFEMCGVIEGRVKFRERRLVNYVEGEFRRSCILGSRGIRFKGHEFHRSVIELGDENKNKNQFAYRMLRGEGIYEGLDGLITNNCLASYTHLHAASYREFAPNFVESARRARGRSQK